MEALQNQDMEIYTILHLKSNIIKGILWAEKISWKLVTCCLKLKSLVRTFLRYVGVRCIENAQIFSSWWMHAFSGHVR